jgi:RNA polymerase sigma factor (sigma-70 family)
VTVDRLDPLQRRLATLMSAKAGKIAKRYARLNPRYAQDIESSAYWGAVRAAREYDKSRDDRVWLRWSSLLISYEIREFLRSAWVRHASQAEEEVLEELESSDRPMCEAEQDGFDRLVGMLTPTQRDVCALVYRAGMSPAEAGRALGMKGRRGCRVHKEAVERLREILGAKTAA